MLPSGGAVGTGSEEVIFKRQPNCRKPRNQQTTASRGSTDLSIKPKEKDLLSAEDIKQSKDRINSLRNILPFYGNLRSTSKEKIQLKEANSVIETVIENINDDEKNKEGKKTKEKSCNEISEDDEKDKCEGSDSESISEAKPTSIVHSRIANYELPYKIKYDPAATNIKDEKQKTIKYAGKESPEAKYSPSASTLKSKTIDGTCRPIKSGKGRLSSLKERYQNSVTNLTYEGFGFPSLEKCSGADSCDINNDEARTSSKKAVSLTTKIDNDFIISGTDPKSDPKSSIAIAGQNNLIYQLQSQIDKLEGSDKNESTSNVIVGNKDILKLLSNKHLANLNIRVERNPDFKRDRLADNRWRDNLGSFRASKSGIRTSFRSSKRKRKNRYRVNNPQVTSEEKGTSDSTLKENETDSENEMNIRIRQQTPKTNNVFEKESPYATGEYIKKKFPEYAKVNKRKSIITHTDTDIPPRSLSTSPIERAPVVKKICSSGVRLKKDSEPSLMVNPVKKADSFRGSRVTRKNSFLYNTRGKTTKETTDHESFVKTQAIRLRRKGSKNTKKSEYRVSVTIRPSTVANLANKFNTIILQNQSGSTSVQSGVPFGQVSLETKVPKYYSSPRASFKRKYRHKTSRAARETKEKEVPKSELEIKAEVQGIDNTIYYSENLSAASRRSLSNSLSELNMKDLFDDCDYNKTDEEKVCEKLKTALSSGKFKGETDDSEDDLSSKTLNTGKEEISEEHSNTESSSVEDQAKLSTSLEPIMNLDCDETIIKSLNDKVDNVKSDLQNLEKDQNTTDCESTSDIRAHVREGHSKSDSIDSGISTDELKLGKEFTNSIKDPNEMGALPDKEISSQMSEESEESKEEPVYAEKFFISSVELFPSVQNKHVNEEQKFVTQETESIKNDKPLNGNLESYKAISNEELPMDDFISIKTNKSGDSGVSSLNLINNGERIINDIESPSEKEPTEKQTKGDECQLDGAVKESCTSPTEKEFNVIQFDECSFHDDTYSEASSICSDIKGKKSKGEMRIYTSLKAAMKNTVKKTKEKDADKKLNEKDRRKRSPSQERGKWFKRGKSKDRKHEKPGLNENEKGKCKKEKEGNLYEKFTFKKFGEKSQEKSKDKEKSKESTMKSTKACGISNTEDDTVSINSESDKYQDVITKKEETKESIYGKLKFASRARSREKKENKKPSVSSFVESIKEEKDDGPTLDAKTVFLFTSEVSQDNSEIDKTNEENLIYEPHSPTGAKIIPPPPKTPIPSPPKPFKKFLQKSKTPKGIKNKKLTEVPEDSSVKIETAENIYENLYKELEGRGIKPNSSFLWSDTAIVSTNATKATLTKVNLQSVESEANKFHENTYGTCKEGDEHSVRYDEIGSPLTTKKSADDSSSDGHNYTEIHNTSSGDSQTIAYDDVGPSSAGSYDEVASPSSCGYDDIRPPSSQGYDPFKTPSEGYDPVNPPKSDSSQYDGVVTAHLAVVKENQVDSLSYVYDDVSIYNASQASHSYEPIGPPDTATSQYAISTNLEKVQEVEKPSTSNVVASAFETTKEYPLDDSDNSEYGPHHVISYKLTNLGVQNEETYTKISSDVSKPSADSSSIPCQSNQKLFKQKSDKGSPLYKPSYSTALPEATKRKVNSYLSSLDGWMDISDSEEERDVPVTLMTHIPFVRKPRPKRVARYRVNRRSWTQGVRDVAAHNTRPHHSQTKAAVSHAHSSNPTKVTPHAHARTHITHTRSHTHIRTNTDHVITCSWREKRTDSDDDEEATGQYEAIYEVISPADEEKVSNDLPEEELNFQDQDHQDDPELDDSFDSDDSDETYSRFRPRYADDKNADACDRIDSFSSDVSGDKKYLRRKYNRSHSHQPHSINKIAEAANLGMKRLRRNWSLTKNEVRTGLSRIKKKSTFSMSDMKSTEDILSEVNNSCSEKEKWSFKSHFRRKSSSSTLPRSLSPSLQDKKDKATFYLTLTIASDRQETEGVYQEASPKILEATHGSSVLERRKSNTPSVSSLATTTSCDTTVSFKARPLSAPGTTLFRNTSTGSGSGAIYRPTTAPPAPPNDPGDNDDVWDMTMDKDKLATRLNQILSSGPVAPPGRRILRTSDCSSTEVSPVPLLLPPDEKAHCISPTKYSSISHSFSGSKGSLCSRQLPPDVTNSITHNIPQARASIVSSSSHGSSEGYIRPSDIASAPPPLPARPSSSSLSSISSNPPVRRQSQSLSHHLTSPPIMTLGPTDADNRSYLELNCESHLEEESPYVSSHFADEPLYQFYTAKVERAALYQGDCSSEDDYEVINDGTLNNGAKSPQSRPTAMELVTPADGRRTLWCELPEVVDSGILNKINSQERKIQEAMFEVVTSEASYLKSLGVLVTHFMNCPEFVRSEDPVISKRERKVLFSDILPVKKCSELFLADLEKRWQESFRIPGITDIVLKHATSSFNIYVKYCSYQIYQDRMLRELKLNNPRFFEVLNRLESAPICQSLAMHSFLMLPMQRITRLPLLIDAIFNRLEYGSPQWQECKIALASLTKIVTECNEGARRMERMEEMLIVSRQLDFREVKAIPLTSASRWLVKKGELTRLTWREGDAKLTFGRKISKHSLYFFLFTDLLVVTKKKSDDQHMVLDYCPRNMVQVLELESADKFPGRLLDGHKNLIIMTMLQNHENKTVEMVLSCPLESDRTRWMEAVTPRISENPDERIYEEWDCPQVQVVHVYVSTQPDELSLEISDVFNVLKKTSDGWYQGERLRDGSRGWFPGNHTVEIASAHVRARNLRQRYRLLAISGSIVDELKKEKEKYEKEDKKKVRRRTITIKEVL